MEINYKELKALFISDQMQAIKESQQIISTVSNFNSFNDFYNYHLQNSHVSTCQNAWSKYQMAVHCVECSTNPSSCFCLQCFLNSNHQGHEYLIRPDSRGNCDCGDLSLWKRSGFCPKHYGLEDDSHPEDYLDEKLRTILTDTIYKASFSALKHLRNEDESKFSPIFQFLISFLKFGDGFRRLLAISLTERINFENFLNCIFDSTVSYNQQLQRFFGLLVNDQLFKNNFSRINYKLMITKILPISLAEMVSTDINESLSVWNSFWFHSYQPSPMRYNIEHFQWDWAEFSIYTLNYIKEILLYVKDFRFKNDIPSIFYNLVNMKDASEIQPNEETQNLFDKIFTEILTRGTKKGIIENVNDTIIVESYKNTTDFNSYLPVYYFNYLFFEIFESFKNKKNLKLDKMFIELDKEINIDKIYLVKNENDKFISHLIKQELNENELNEDSYKSFIKGASFFFNHPLFYSVAHMFRNDDLCRVKIARFLCSEKYQSLRVRLGIATLKSILSFVTLSQSLVPKGNAGLVQVQSIYINNPNLVDLGIPLLFPLFQLLVGLKSNEKEFNLKEFFAFEMAREIGIFDISNKKENEEEEEEENEENQKQMIFSYLYLSILLVIERTLFNFDGYDLIKEQLVFALKNGISNLNNLKDLFDKRVSPSLHYVCDMNKVISEIATVRKRVKKEEDNNDQEALFDLKEGIECKYISAINSFNIEKVLMNDEISKHPEKLIKIQSFEPEETYFFNKQEEEDIDSNGLCIQLKEFLMTPTVLAVIYQTLRNDSESPKVELNDHLAMNILLLISKFLQETENKKSETVFNDIEEIHYESSIVDLIAQLKRIVFNFTTDENGNPSIQNTLTKEAFNSFLRIKIGHDNQVPKSFIDILLEKGEIGRNVLGQMSIEIEGIDNQKEKQDLNKTKKMRANKLKEDIMNHYKSITASFSMNDDDQNDEGMTPISTEKDVCSICSNSRKNEVLAYPLYLYRTKFPFIFDKPPIVEITTVKAIREREVFEDYQNVLENDQNDEEEEEELPNPEDFLAQILSRSPELDITDDLSEEEAERRRGMINFLHETLCKKYEEAKERREEQRKEREKQKLLRIEQEKEEEKLRMKSLEHPDLLVSKRLTPGNLFVIQFGICQHLVHPDCVDKDDFTCPIDRSIKNGFLPNIDDLPKDVIFEKMSSEVTSENLSAELKEALTLFINKYTSFFKASDEKIVDLFVELVKSISGMITTFEVRLRSLPDCLDSKKNSFLARNLFLTTWYAYRMKGKPVMKTGFLNDDTEKVDSRLTVFQRFIKKLIECDDIENDNLQKNQLLNQLVSSFIPSFDNENEKDLCLFLRRVCLADHFLLKSVKKDDEQKFIDWDEILSPSNLSQKFNVTFKSLNISEGEEFEFKPFIFSKIPKEFLRFSQDPYNFPVDQTHEYSMFNMLDYNYLIKNYNDDDDDNVHINYSDELYKFSKDTKINLFLKSNFSQKNYPSVILFIGCFASDICVIDGNRMVFMRPFYLDRYGCADIGYKRSQPLFLKEERYERVMDEIISGEFTNNLKYF
ncbi:hypothetical protein M9Y10_033459 [Tritrichomonas musculus]|uniref:E3 ubiquitin-protein ligase n=1 Tax=Tritrichomonas musculus TaxID=1915356 RepID=A0ABR2KFE5_9EUKA